MDNGLEKKLEIFLKKYDCLDENNNEINCIDYIDKVIYVNLSASKLKEIPDELYYFENLCSLNLNSNYFTSLKNFEYFNKLEYLNLNYNNIENLLTNFPLTIKNLQLKYNLIKSVTFKNFEKLEHLDLSNNFIFEIKNIAELKNIREIILSNNKLISIPNFDNPKIENISLINNRIKTIQGFENLKSVNIKLEKNPIKYSKLNFEEITKKSILTLPNNIDISENDIEEKNLKYLKRIEEIKIEKEILIFNIRKRKKEKETKNLINFKRKINKKDDNDDNGGNINFGF